jgi:hypothetical protein
MPECVLFVGTYEIPAGQVDAFRAQARVMTELVRDREPRVIAIGHYVNDNESEGTSIHLHPDADSFDFHMAELAQAIDTGSRIVQVKRIEFFGTPHADVLERLSLTYDVRVKAWADGYSRLTTD